MIACFFLYNPYFSISFSPVTTSPCEIEAQEHGGGCLFTTMSPVPESVSYIADAREKTSDFFICLLFNSTIPHWFCISFYVCICIWSAVVIIQSFTSLSPVSFGSLNRFIMAALSLFLLSLPSGPSDM